MIWLRPLSWLKKMYKDQCISQERCCSCSKMGANVLESMISLSFIRSSVATSHLSIRISEASTPHNALRLFSLLVASVLQLASWRNSIWRSLCLRRSCQRCCTSCFMAIWSLFEQFDLYTSFNVEDAACSIWLAMHGPVFTLPSPAEINTIVDWLSSKHGNISNSSCL